MTSTQVSYDRLDECLADADDVVYVRANETHCLGAEEIGRELMSQFATPADYPPLSQATIPGDQVAIAVAPGVPNSEAIVLGLLAALADANVNDDQVTVLVAESTTQVESLQAALESAGFGRSGVKLHDPDNEKVMAMLGISAAGDAIRLNRELCDADLVLPVNLSGGHGMSDSRGDAGQHVLPASCIFPTFSDRETIERFHLASAEHFPAYSAESGTEVVECARQLGIGLSVEVVPAASDEVSALVVGESTRAAELAQAKYQAIWCSQATSAGNLVIATLSRNSRGQFWRNVGCAVAAAEAVLQPDGAIVLCGEFDVPFSQGLSLLAEGNDPSLIEREILRTPSTDSGAALQLCHALDRSSIYVFSAHAKTAVESLGMTRLDGESELERLMQAHRPCVVLEQADRLLPTLVNAESETT